MRCSPMVLVVALAAGCGQQPGSMLGDGGSDGQTSDRAADVPMGEAGGPGAPAELRCAERPTRAWSPLGGDRPAGDLSLRQHPRDRGTLIAARSLPPYLSRDGGRTWCRLELPFPASALHISPADPATMFLAPSASYRPDVPRAFLRSRNAGVSWEVLPVSANFIFSRFTPGPVTMDHHDRDVLYAFHQYSPGDMSASVDGGTSWSRVDAFPMFSLPRMIVADPNRARAVFVVLDGGSSGSPALLVSDDAARSFQTRTLPTTGRFPGFAASRRALFVADGNRVWRSFDRGLTWQSAADLGAAGLKATTLHAPLGANDPIYAASGYRIWKSLDLGESWSERASEDMWVVGVAHEGEIVGSPSDWRGVLFSDDDGRSFTDVAPMMRGRVVLSAAAPRVIYVDGQDAISSSLDDGVSWERYSRPVSTTPPRFPLTHGVIVDPTNPTVVFTFGPGDSGGGNVVLRSGDRGRTWAPWPVLDGTTPAIKVRTVVVSPAGPGTAYATTDRGFARTGDGGRTWSAAINPLGAPPDDLRFTVASASGRDLYLWGAGAVMSRDGGVTFSADGLGMRLRSLVPHPLDPLLAYALVSSSEFTPGEGDAYRTTDGGATWTRLEIDRYVTEIVVHPGDVQVAYAAASAGRLWKTTDAGASWRQLDTPERADWQIRVDPRDGEVLYAFAVRRALYKRHPDGRWSRLAPVCFDNSVELEEMIDLAVGPGGDLFGRGEWTICRSSTGGE